VGVDDVEVLLLEVLACMDLKVLYEISVGDVVEW
jgi:hypothetical protein